MSARFNKRYVPPSYLLSGRLQPRSLAEAQATYDHARTVAVLLDSTGSLFGLRGISASFGLDPLLSLIPIAGPFAGLILGLYIVLLSWMLGADAQLLGRMAVNLAIDASAGLIPLVGPLVDAAFKANELNVGLLEKHIRSSRWAAVALPPARSFFPKFGRRSGPTGTATL